MVSKSTSPGRSFSLNYLSIFFLLFVVLVPCRNSFALPALFQDELVASGLNQPTATTFLPDGRILITQKAGQIFILDPRVVSPVLNSYMEITDINFGGERGLINIVLDPQFPAQPYIYVVYHRNSDETMLISRFTHQGDTASIDSEFIVWSNPGKYTHRFHQGGGLSFGPDGYIYLTTGEQFNGLSAQDLSNANGKIIRVARDGTIPSDNPYFGPDGNLDEIWAFGLRNPWRATWDIPSSGTIGPRLFIGEVGGNLGSANEDIHLGKKGANYGWPYCEGAQCNNSNQFYDPPLFTYEHLSKGAAIVGGFVYHGSQFPATFSDVYFYGDYSKRVAGKRGIIRYLTFDNNGAVASDNAFLENAGSIVDLREGRDGALYYLEIASSENFIANTGALNRVTYNDGNQAPQITSAVANITDGETPLTVQFSGSATDAENDDLQYLWVFGDGEQAEGANVSHQYTQNGSYQASLQVSDFSKTTVSNPPLTITVGSKPVVTIIEPTDGSTFLAGETINFSASATDDGVLTENSYKWTVLFVHNEHTHPEQGPIVGSSGILHTPNSGHSFFDETGFEISVEVTDQDGVSTNKIVRIFPEKSDITFNSQPSGISFFIDGTIITSPIVYDTAVGFIHNLTAPQTTCLNGNQKYIFTGWSNGEAASHNYMVPAQNETLTAIYAADGICDANTNLSPLAFSDEISMANNATRIINVLENDIDSDGSLDQSTVLITREPQHGQVTIDGVTGSITYSHDGSAMTGDSFTYIVEDDKGAVSNEATVLISITGTDTGGTDPIASCGTGIELDGINDWVNIPDLTLSGDFTIEGWVKLAPGIDNKDAMFGQEGGGPDINFYGGKARLYSYGDRVTANTELLPNTWGHIAITRSGTNLKIYSNGVEDGTGSWNGALSLKAIGRGNRGYFGGMLDEVRVWNVARTGDEISENYDNSVDPNSTGLIGYWSFNETDQTVMDASGEANHGSFGASIAEGVDDPEQLISNAPFSESCDGGNTGGGSNVAPIAVNDTSGSIQIGGAISYAVTDNDVDSNGNLDLTSVSIVSQPSNGAATVNGSGIITYIHSGTVAITDTITYTVKDDEGEISNVATLSVEVVAAIPTSAIIVDEFKNGNAVGSWVIQQPAQANFIYSATPEKISIDGDQYNRYLTRENTEIDFNRPYSMSSKFRITSPTGVRAFAMHFLQGNQPSTEGLNGWSLNIDLYAGGQVKYLGYKNGIQFSLGLHAATWGQANTDYIYQVDVNRRKDGSVSPKWVTGKITEVNGTVLDHFEVYFGDFRWQPDPNETVRIGLASHNADWEVRDLLVKYTDNNTEVPVENSPPVANAGVDQTRTDSDESGSETIALDASLSSDIDGDNLTYNWSENGNLLGSGQTINHSFNVGVHIVILTVDDGQGHEVSDAVIITVDGVTPANNDPIAQADNATVPIGETVTINVLANDIDSDGSLNTSSVLIVASPTNGVVTVNAAGTITYLNTGNTATTDTLRYTVADTEGAISNEATVSITVTEPTVDNQIPVTQEDTATVQSGEAVTVDVLTNDNDSDGTLDKTSLVIVSQPGFGTVDIDYDTGDITYTHDGTAETSDSFTYTIDDNEAATSNEATVSINITHLAASCGKGIELDGSNDFVNIPDLTLGSDFTVETWVKLAPGIDYRDGLFGNGSNMHLYFVSGKARLYAFGVRVTATTAIIADTWAHIALTRSGTTLTMYVNGVEDAIGNWNGGFSIKSLGQGYRGYFNGMMDEVRIWNVARTGAEIGASYDTTVDPNALGLIGYWNFNGADQIITDASSSANHASLGSSTAIGTDDPVRLDSTAPVIENCDGGNTGGNSNVAPVASDDTAGSVEAGGTLSITVTSNDVDNDGNLDPTSVTIVSMPADGTAIVNASGTISYSNTGDTATTDTLSYKVADTDGVFSNEATVTITVTEPTIINVAPVANDDTVGSVEVGGTITFTVTGNDLDIDGNLNSASVEIIGSGPSDGTATVGGSGTITYRNTGNTATTDTLIYTVADAEGLISNEATVSISVTESTPSNAIPVTQADTATVQIGEAVTIDVLSNDNDSDGTLNKNSLAVVSNPIFGTVEIDTSTGEITYTHDGSATSNDSFIYTIEDDQGDVSNEAMVSITITQLAASCGKGIELDGSNDLINIPDLTLGSDFTVESWVKLAPGIDYRDGLFGDGSNAHLYFVSGKARLYAFGVRVTANTAITADTWAHIALTRSGTKLTMYVNGVEDGTGSWNGSYSIKSLGKGYRGYFKGMMDEVRIWNVARTGAEIGASYDTTVDPDAAGLIGYWNFNGVDQIITDSSSSANHASLGASSAIGTDDPVRLDSTAPLTESCL